MVGLIDIGPLGETITVGGKPVGVTGVSASGIFVLLSRFPELREMFERRGATPEKLVAAGGGIVAAVIAAGTGTPGDPEAERIAAGLPLGAQLDLLEPIWRLTFPNGVGAALEQVRRLMQAAAPGRSGTAPATSSPKRSRR